MVSEIQWLLEGLDRTYGEVLALRLEGWETCEIADRTPFSRWIIRRILKRLGDRLERRAGNFLRE